MRRVTCIPCRGSGTAVVAATFTDCNHNKGSSNQCALEGGLGSRMQPSVFPSSWWPQQCRRYCINLDDLGDMPPPPPPPPPPSGPGGASGGGGASHISFDVAEKTPGIVPAAERGREGLNSKNLYNCDWDSLNHGHGTVSKRLIRQFIEREGLPHMLEGKPSDYAVLKGLLQVPLPLTVIMAKADKDLELDVLQDFNSQAVEYYQRLVEAQELTLITLTWHPSVPVMHRVVNKPIQVQLDAMKELFTTTPPDSNFWTKLYVNLRPNGVGVVKQRFGGHAYTELQEQYQEFVPCPADVFRVARAVTAHDHSTSLKDLEAKMVRGDVMDVPNGKKTVAYIQPLIIRGSSNKSNRHVTAMQLVLAFPQYFDLKIAEPEAGGVNWSIRYTLWPAYFPHEVSKPMEELQSEIEEFTREHAVMQQEMKDGRRFRAKDMKNMLEMKGPLLQALEIKKRHSIFIDPNVVIYYIFDLLPHDNSFAPLQKDVVSALSKEARRNMLSGFLSKKRLKDYPRMLSVFDDAPPEWGLQRVDAPKHIGIDYSRLNHEDVKDLLLKAVNTSFAKRKDPDIRCGISFLSTLLPGKVRDRVKNHLGGWSGVCERFDDVFDLEADGVSWKLKLIKNENESPGKASRNRR